MSRPPKSKNHAAARIEAEGLDMQIGFQLRLAQLATFSDIIEALKAINLRPVDMSALILIDAKPGLRQHVIGDRLRIQRPNIVALVDALVTRGLIARDIDQTDRRANTLHLTEEGHAILAEARRIQEAHTRRLLAALHGVDIDNFMKSLKQLAALPYRKGGET